jgi:hypothetical protein
MGKPSQFTRTLNILTLAVVRRILERLPDGGFET